MTGAWKRGLVLLCWAALPLLTPHVVNEGVIQEATHLWGTHSERSGEADLATENGAVPGNPNSPRGVYDELIEVTAAAEGMDVDLVHAVIATESRYDRLARSPKGAKGLMQLMPETAARYAVRDPFDPADNIRGGIRHLRFLQEKFSGRLRWALAAYHAGETAVLRHQGVPPFRETQNYVTCVLAHYAFRAGRPISPQRAGYQEYAHSRMLSKLDDPWPSRRSNLTASGAPAPARTRYSIIGRSQALSLWSSRPASTCSPGQARRGPRTDDPPSPPPDRIYHPQQLPTHG